MKKAVASIGIGVIATIGAISPAGADRLSESACAQLDDLDSSGADNKRDRATLVRVGKALRRSNENGAARIATGLRNAKTDRRRSSAIDDALDWCSSVNVDQPEVDRVIDLWLRGNNAVYGETLSTTLAGLIANWSTAAGDWNQVGDTLLNRSPEGVPNRIARDAGSAAQSAATAMEVATTCAQSSPPGALAAVTACGSAIEIARERAGDMNAELRALIQYGSRSASNVVAELPPNAP